MPRPGATARNKLPSFSPDTAGIRQADWTVATRKGAAATTIVVDSVAKTFGLEELLHQHRDASVALEIDPDGYLFSFIQICSDRPECILPDRADMTYSTHCLRSYARYVHDVAKRRGAVVGAAPDDSLGLFLESDEPVVAEDLLQVPRGRITEQGVRLNIGTVLRGVAALLATGTPPENRSEIELCRAQLWQCVQHETGVLDTGRIVTPVLFANWLDEELAATKASAPAAESGHLEQAAALLQELTGEAELAPSLVDEAYRLVE